MRLRSLQSRIVLLFLVLILAVQSCGFFAIRTGIEENAQLSIREELKVGERVFKRLLNLYAQNLTQGARVLASDYGFKQAIGTDDTETIVSALSNHGGRIGASVAVLIGTDRNIKASTTDRQENNFHKLILALLDEAERGDGAAGNGILGGQPYQIVVMPVKAPVTIGWVAMAFPIARQLAFDMRDLSQMHVSMMVSGAGGEWLPHASTMSTAMAAALAASLRGGGDGERFIPQLHVGDDDFGTRTLVFAKDAQQTAMVVLQHSISEAVAPYRRLQITLLVINAFGILVTLFGSMFMARRITGPLHRLS